jgi:hypothetical protein
MGPYASLAGRRSVESPPAYQEEQVVSAATTNRLRLFIHLPIIEVNKSFELYEIFVLLVFSTAGNIGLRYAPIPAFLTVGKDRQTFMELSVRSTSLSRSIGLRLLTEQSNIPKEFYENLRNGAIPTRP